MAATHRKLVLTIVATDNTFRQQQVRGQLMWVGRCIHCRTKLVVANDGDTGEQVTVEHIVPRHHGGTNDAENLALACRRCNHEKGRRHDNKSRRDQRRMEVEQALLARRRLRWRDPE